MTTHRSVRPLLAFLVCLVLTLATGTVAFAASPSAGSVSETSPGTTWTGGPMLATASATCGGPQGAGCDHFALTVTPLSGPSRLSIEVTAGPLDDYDLELYDPSGQLVGSSGNAPGEVETIAIDDPVAGTYTVSVSPYLALTSYSASANLAERAGAPPPSAEPAPLYDIYPAPEGVGRGAGEPTLGVNEQTGAVMFIAGLETLRVEFDQCAPARDTWTDVSFVTTSITTFDPILWTDQELGRTFVSQLLFPTKQSAMAFTDDDGETWFPSQGSGINTGVDHQAVGGGPFAQGGLLGPLTSYPNAVYYCAQDIGLAQCAVSLDGGTTFGPGVPLYTLLECGGLHGHPKVGPDGAVYVPNKGCGGEQAVVASFDNGLTWDVRPVPGSTASSWDPSAAVGSDGTLYLGWAGGDGHARVAVSADQGQTWDHIQDVGAAFGVQNLAFPVIVAGDGDRAAFAFLGTTAGGAANGDDPNFPAEWHLYVAHTYDRGQSWVTTDLTPNDPVQRGTICAGGTSCGVTRNLLDFMDVTKDAEGRVLVAYADGCVGGCASGGANSGTEVGTIARLTSGKGLYAAFDGTLADGESCGAPPPPPEPVGDICQVPGQRVTDDPQGDGLLPSHDVVDLRISEPATADGRHDLVFTVEVDEIGTLVPGNAWMVLWNRPAPDATHDRNYVVMRATGPYQADFQVGKLSPPSLNQATDMGAIEGSFSNDGTITLRVSTDQIDGVTAGQDLAGLEVRTFAVQTSGLPASQATAVDFTSAANYTLQGNGSCTLDSGLTAHDDSATTLENKPVAIDVLANDVDPEGGELVVTATTAPASGVAVAKKKGGMVTYRPDSHFTGTDSFQYTARDSVGNQVTATVTVEVKPK